MIKQQRAVNAYSSVQMQGRLGGDANGVELVILLLEGVLDRLGRAKRAIERGDVQEQVAMIDKVLEIISEGLRAYLDMESGGDLARRLDDLYGYCCTRLLAANANKDTKILDEIHGLLEPLLEAWRELRNPAAASTAAHAQQQSEPISAAPALGRLDSTYARG